MIKDHLHPIDCKRCSMRKDSVFCDLHDNELETMNTAKTCFVYKKGEEIFDEGGNPHGLYCISEGKVKLSKFGNSGREQIVRIAMESDVLGYRALLGEETYDCSAIALTDAKVCFIPKTEFNQLFESNTHLAKNMVKLLASDLRTAEQLATKIAQKPVRERIAEVILKLKNMVGTESDGQTIKLVLSREELANMAGTVTETTIRFLSELKSDGVIDFDGKKIKIMNQAELIKRANIYN